MNKVDDVISLIHSFLEETKTSRQSLCDEAGLSSSVFKNFDEDWNPRAKTLSKLEKAIPSWYQKPINGDPNGS